MPCCAFPVRHFPKWSAVASEMSLMRLPDGSFIDPDYNHVGAVFKRPPSPAQGLHSWVVFVISQMCQYAISCVDEAEADAHLGAIAAMLGYSDVTVAGVGMEKARSKLQ